MLPVTPSEGYAASSVTMSAFRKNINNVLNENYIFDFIVC